MKKVVRTVWIGALSGLAFLAACCTPKDGLSRAERKQLIKERDSIQKILEKRESSCVYGSPEIIASYGLKTMELRSRLDSINYRLGKDVNLEENAKRVEDQKKKVEKMEKQSDLRMRLEKLWDVIRERESSCVYGSPEVIKMYEAETNSLRQEADSLAKELQELENE